jgi:signal transducing adaptor molecule
LTTENWDYILTVCDTVNEDPENGAQNAIKHLIPKLTTTNANQQLYTLTLLGSLAQNCGSKMHREIATRAIVSKLHDLVAPEKHGVYNTVRARAWEVWESLVREFKGDPSLRLVADGLEQAKRSYPGAAAAVAPEVPKKQRMTDLDRKREEEELQMVLALSLQESQQKTPAQTQEQQQQAKPDEPTQPVAGKTAATVSRVKAIYDLHSEDPGELSFRRGDVITVLESVYKDWWKGSLKGQVGIFPLNYVEPIPEPTEEELRQEQLEEERIFEESRNIDKLLNLLTTSPGASLADNEEVQQLYRSTQNIRPKLIRMIEKYATKRDDLVELDRKFVSARRTYDELIESSLSQISNDAHGGPVGGYGAPAPSGGVSYYVQQQQPHQQQQQTPQQQPVQYQYTGPQQQQVQYQYTGPQQPLQPQQPQTYQYN